MNGEASEIQLVGTSIATTIKIISRLLGETDAAKLCIGEAIDAVENAGERCGRPSHGRRNRLLARSTRDTRISPPTGVPVEMAFMTIADIVRRNLCSGRHLLVG
jgi:hypothetical protein